MNWGGGPPLDLPLRSEHFWCCCFYQLTLLIVSKSTFLRNSFRYTIWVSNRLDPDHAWQNVRSDLDPYCLSRAWSESNLFAKVMSRQSECQTDWIQIRPDKILGLIWIQSVCKGHEQTTLVGNEFKKTQIFFLWRLPTYVLVGNKEKIFLIMYYYLKACKLLS